MNSETAFWSTVTALALAALLVLYAQDVGLFEREVNEADSTDEDTSPDTSGNSTEGNDTQEANSTDEDTSPDTSGNSTEGNGTQETNSTESQSSTADSPDQLALECLDHNGLARHDHVTLQIYIDGEGYTVESAIGIQTDICNGNENNMHTVHTHDDTGRLHVELNEPGNISLGVFFDIWGHHFNETGIFDYRVNATHEMVMHVHASNESASEENRVTSFDDYLLQNGEVIEVHYRAKAN